MCVSYYDVSLQPSADEHQSLFTTTLWDVLPVKALNAESILGSEKTDGASLMVVVS